MRELKQAALRRSFERFKQTEWSSDTAPFGEAQGAPSASRGAREAALRQYIKPQYQRVCATAERLPFPDNSFRFLFTIAALEHVPRADLAFE